MTHRLVAALLALCATSLTSAAEPSRTPTRGATARSLTPVPTGPRPASLVPEQPLVGTPAAAEKPYVEILRMKEAGASDKALLAKVRGESRQYSLTTSEIQKLRAAKVPPAVIEAMLKSGRSATPSAPTRTPTPR
jgi:hypothetical protein